MATDNSSKNFGLSVDEFDRLILQLQGGDESLFEHIFLAHFEDCLVYIKRKFNASQEDAYDVTMDTLLAFRQRLVDGKVHYGNMRFLFTQMAGQVYLKRIKYNNVTGELTTLHEQLVEEIEKGGYGEVLQKAWKALCDSCRSVLTKYYYYKTPLKEIAQEANKSDAAIRKQKQRCMEKLQGIFKKLVIE